MPCRAQSTTSCRNTHRQRQLVCEGRQRTTKSLHPRSPACIAMKANAQAAEHNVERRYRLKSATGGIQPFLCNDVSCFACPILITSSLSTQFQMLFHLLFLFACSCSGNAPGFQFEHCVTHTAHRPRIRNMSPRLTTWRRREDRDRQQHQIVAHEDCLR